VSAGRSFPHVTDITFHNFYWKQQNDDKSIKKKNESWTTKVFVRFWKQKGFTQIRASCHPSSISPCACLRWRNTKLNKGDQFLSN